MTPSLGLFGELGKEVKKRKKEKNQQVFGKEVKKRKKEKNLWVFLKINQKL